VDGNPATTPNTYTMNYDTSGNLTNTTPFSVTFSPTPVNGSSSPVTLSIDYTGSTQVAQASGTPTETVDGYAPGTLSSMNIDTHGNIMASFLQWPEQNHRAGGPGHLHQLARLAE
jgi:flagellar hook protein FlgE